MKGNDPDGEWWRGMIRIPNPQGYHIYCIPPKGFNRRCVGPAGSPLVSHAWWEDHFDGEIIEHCPKEFGW